MSKLAPQKLFSPFPRCGRPPPVRTCIAILAPLLATITGCAPVRTITPDFGSALIGSMTKGETRLTCGLSCAFQYGAKRRELKELYDQGRWQDLALLVIGLGYKNDQSYFYLGRAAEMLNAPAAALVYYHLGKMPKGEIVQCGIGINVCDGFEFPHDIDIHLIALANLIPQQNPGAQEKVLEKSVPSTVLPNLQSELTPPVGEDLTAAQAPNVVNGAASSSVLAPTEN